MDKLTLLALVSLFQNLLLAAQDDELKIAPVFSDHMVLQRDKRVKVWGWANAGATVTVAFAGQSKTAKARSDGGWLLQLKPLKASAEGRELHVTCGTNRVAIHDVLVGEVWLLGGQSNMEMEVTPTGL